MTYLSSKIAQIWKERCLRLHVPKVSHFICAKNIYISWLMKIFFLFSYNQIFASSHCWILKQYSPMIQWMNVSCFMFVQVTFELLLPKAMIVIYNIGSQNFSTPLIFFVVHRSLEVSISCCLDQIIVNTPDRVYNYEFKTRT